MLRRLYNMMRKKKEIMPENKSQKKIVFTMNGDGMKPKNVPWGAGLRLPVPIAINPGETKHVNFLVSCNHACLIVPMKRCSEYSLSVAEAGTVVLPGDNITVKLTSYSKSKVPILLESGDMLVSLHPLVWDGEVEGS